MGAPPAICGILRGGPACRGAPAAEGLNLAYWTGAPLMRATTRTISRGGVTYRVGFGSPWKVSFNQPTITAAISSLFFSSIIMWPLP